MALLERDLDDLKLAFREFISMLVLNGSLPYTGLPSEGFFPN